jgi:hypothetical protein
MKYATLASESSISHTISSLINNGIDAICVKTGQDALEKIKEMIPKDASVMNGSSRTLEQIGFIEYLKSGIHGWNNFHEKIIAQKDPAKQMALRKQSSLSDYYLGSVHALTQNGEMIIASNTGSQLPHIVFTSPNLIFVVGTQKIVTDLTDGMSRLKEYVLPLEDKHMHELYGIGTMISKIVIFNRENPLMGRKVHLILVKEKLGF